MRLSRGLGIVLAAVTAAIASAGSASNAGPQPPWNEKVDPWVIAATSAGPAEFLVFLAKQADLAPAGRLPTKAQKGRFVVERLRETAARTQGPLLAALGARNVDHRPYWVANMVWVRGDRALVEELARRDDVAHVYANPSVKLHEPVEQGAPEFDAPAAVEWGVAKVRAPEVWAAGFNGQGVVVGGQDTGYDWNHPAIKGKYRGWNGVTANHAFSWHDAIHSGGGVCGADSPQPCDDTNHGTHTMGTMVGDDGAGNQVGVAPGAKWIGCRNMDQGNGTPATYSECFQWFLAPGTDPAMAPDVINNSWGCPPSEGCTDPNALKTVVENTRAAGIVVVVSAGNSGSGCSSVSDPPAIYQASFSVGATSNTATDTIAGFSSRGPVTIDGSNRLKPNVSAPGVGVRSSIPGGGYANFSGTSMAGPHVVGVVALLLSAQPALSGDVSAVEARLQSSAVPRTTTETCGGIPGTTIPNNTYGYGRVDAYGAVNPGFGFHAIPPCRVVDTRSGPPLSAGADRTLPVTGVCLVPATATAVAGNLTVTQPTAAGFLTLFPAGTTLPTTSTINYSVGRTRANNGIFGLGFGGALVVHSGQASGTTHLLLDVYGYFE